MRALSEQLGVGGVAVTTQAAGGMINKDLDARDKHIYNM